MEGGSLDQRIKGTPQPPRVAAELVETLSRAVHAAHQCGVVHRDLKPSNILLQSANLESHLAKQEEIAPSKSAIFNLQSAIPKITDFGLAKRLDDNLGQTQTGAVIGTPSYMAPEQAAGRSREIGPATDIYALGAILYELVTGRPPFLADSHEATRQLVIHDEPVPPRRLQPSLPRNLETICLKCLQKEPAKRYSSALALAEDLHRFLAGKPILARPATVPERFLRWCRRNPWAASFILALVIGTAVSIYFAVDAKDKADAAVKAQDQVQKRLGQLQKNVEIMASIFADLDIEKVKDGNEPLEAVLAQRLVKAAEALEGEAVGDPEVVGALQNELGTALQNLGYTQEAIALSVKARETYQAKLEADHPKMLTATGNLGFSYQRAGKLDLAVPLLEETLKLRKAKLGADHTDTLKNMNSLASAYQDAGRLDLALPLYEEALKLKKAKLGTDDPTTIVSMNDLASAYFDAGKPDLAVPLYEETLRVAKAKLGPDHPNLVATMNGLGNSYRATGKLDQALPLYQEALKLGKAKMGADHPNTLTSMNNLASAYGANGKLDLAVQLLEESLKLRKAKLVPDHPDTLLSMNNLAMAYQDGGKPDRALPLFQEAAAGMEKRRYEHMYAATIVRNLANCYEQLKQFNQAEAWRRKWLAVVKERSGADSVPYAAELAGLGGNLLQQKKWIEGEAALRECLAIREKKEPDAWTMFNTQSMLGAALLGEARGASKGGDKEALARAAGLYQDAEALLLKGYDGMKQRAAKIPQPVRSTRLTEAAERLVQLYDAQEKKDEAAKWRKELAALKSK